MTDFNYGDIIEYKDATFDENFNAARRWARSHNTTFEELIDRREERDEEETYIAQEEKEVIIPATTKEEVVPAEYDEEGNITKEEETITVDVPEHTETVVEEVEKVRTIKVLYRYFQIGPERVPSEDDLKSKVRMIRNTYLSSYDFTQLDDAPFTEDEKSKYREYRQYLRDYTNQNNWWESNPDDWATWLLAHHPVTGE